MQRNSRANTVLELVAELYVETGKPVSSASIGRRQTGRTWSTATIRKILADLTAEGLLHQAHGSSGRIPTERGFRTYLDGLQPKMHPWDRTKPKRYT